MRSSVLVALAASISATQAVYQGFNYGSAKSDGTFNYQQDFQNKFAAAKALVGTSGFTSARLYTSIQGGSSTNEPTQAIAAAIEENVSLLLGLWASSGSDTIQAELDAITAAVNTHGDAFRKLIAGVSVGSEDLYRISDIAKQSGVTDAGADAATIVGYIGTVKTALAKLQITAPVGHVDTWTAWNDSSNAAVIEAADWIGTDAYPYFQNTMSNDITSGKALFNDALQTVKDRAGNKDVWITETGWPVTGKTENLAIPSTDNAKTYWDQVGCPLFGSVNTWWFTLQDYDGAAGSSPNPSFGIIGNDGKELFDLSCTDISSSSSSSSSASATSSSSGSSTVGSGSSSSTAVSASSTALSSLVTGGGVAPTNGAEGNAPSIASSGSVIATATGSSSGSSSTSGSSGSGSGSGSSAGGSSNATGIATSSPKPTASTTGASPSTVSANAASVLTGSFIGAIGAAFVMIAAL